MRREGAEASNVPGRRAPSTIEARHLFLFQAFHRVVMSLSQTNVYMEGDRY